MKIELTDKEAEALLIVLERELRDSDPTDSYGRRNRQRIARINAKIKEQLKQPPTP